MKFKDFLKVNNAGDLAFLILSISLFILCVSVSIAILFVF